MNDISASSPCVTQQRLSQLIALMPEAFSEGKLDIAALKRVLGETEVIESSEERYRLDWAGKTDSYKVLQTPSSATLRPERDKSSINFDSAPHIFIEGENLEVLKVLQKSYFGKIKLIYIDPPYNTGSDSFVYPDRFQESKEDYLRRINELNDDGSLMREGAFRKNSRENGHYHSNWLSMMLPRLYIARNLLREDGVIFVSIDDNEIHNLRHLMDEIFGEENFCATFPWRSRTAKSDVPFGISSDYEWIVSFARSEKFLAGKKHERNYYKSDDFSERWRLSDLTKQTTKEQRPNSYFQLVNPKNGDCFPANPNRTWSITKTTFTEYYAQGKIVFPGDYDFLNIKTPAFRVFESEDRAKVLKKYSTQETKIALSTFLPEKEVGRTEHGSKQMRELFSDQIFPYPKPSNLIKYLIQACTSRNDIILDFFAGSSTTAHAVMQANYEDGGNRQFIMVQLPEKCAEDSAAFKVGYSTIADISRERIRRVIKQIEKEQSSDLLRKDNPNLGFKSFVLAPSNFRQWRGDHIETAEQLAQQIQLFAQPEKDGATTENILFELLLKFGQPLTTPIEILEIAISNQQSAISNQQSAISNQQSAISNQQSAKVYAINQRNILFVLESFTEAMLWPLLKLKPQEIIAIDRVFNGLDRLKSNLELQCRDAGIRFTCV